MQWHIGGHVALLLYPPYVRQSDEMMTEAIIFHKNPFILRFIIGFFLANSLVFCLAGLSYLYKILSSDSLFVNFNTLVDYHSATGTVFVLLFTLVNYVCFMMFLAAIPALVVWVISLLIPSRRLIWFISPLLSSLCILLLILDSRVYSMFHFHLNSIVVDMIFSKQWLNVFEFSSQEYLFIAGIVVFILVLQYGLAVLVWKKIIRPQRARFGRRIATYWFGGSMYCYLSLCLSISQHNNIFSQQITTLPLYTQLFSCVIPVKNGREYLRRQVEADFVQPVFSGDKLRYPLNPLQCTQPKVPYNIILVMVDDLRFDALQSRHMPHMTGLAEQSWQFKHHLSGGNGTQPGVFSLFYSIPSTYWTAALQQKVPPVLFDQLIQYGYSVQTFWSAETESPNFNDTVFQRFPQLRRNGAPGETIPDRDRQITREAQSFLEGNTRKSPFFLSLFYDAVHGYCAGQNFPQPFQPTKTCFRFNKSNATDPAPERNRYWNAVRFVDLELSKLLATIEKQGYLDNSIIIFTADHAEEFNDNRQNYWGHTSNFSDAQVRVPLFVHWPKEAPQVIDYVTSGYDIVPTLMQGLFSCQNPTEDYSIGQHLLSNTKRPAFVLAGSYTNMGIIGRDRITTLETSGQVSITNKQVKPMPHAKPEMDTIQQAMALMRRYFTK